MKDLITRANNFMARGVISQRSLAEQTGIAQGTLSRALNGHVRLTPAQQDLLAAALVELGAHCYEVLEEMLLARGYVEFPAQSDSIAFKKNWAVHVPGEPCRDNQRKDMIQVVVTIFQLARAYDRHSRPSVSVDVTGTDDLGLWFKLECYTLREEQIGSLDDVVKRLVRSWNLLHQPVTP